MEAKGRFKTRYVVTQRTDGKFLVDVIDSFSGGYLFEDKLFEMDVCKNCLTTLSGKYPNDNLFNFYNFELSQFIERYNTQHTRRPIHTPSSMPKNDYSSDWDSLSNELRDNANFCCSKCDDDFSDKKQLLHVHHKDGVKWNNSLDNLAVLCIFCHSKELGHGKLKYSNQYKMSA